MYLTYLRNIKLSHIISLYLIYHFVTLVPYADELFGDTMSFDHTKSPFHGIFPNALEYVDAQIFVSILLSLSVAFLLSNSKICALLLWYGWACLVNRNILISNPGIPYVGWILLACSMHNSNTPKNKLNVKEVKIYYYAWFLLCFGYTVSGLHKLGSPSWLDGSALYVVLSGPLGYNNLLTNTLLCYPWILRYLTWLSLGLEITYLPLGSFYYCRKLYATIGILFHLGILATVNFADLTLGMLMIHIFVLKVIFY